MSGRFVVSLDDNIDLYSKLANDYEPEEYSSKSDIFNSLESMDILFKYMKYLSNVDSTFLMMSFMHGMSQASISQFLKISQVGVSVRIRRALEKLKFLIDCPNLSFVDVREDFKYLFPEELFEAAFFFYWNHTQTRTKLFLNTTQCGAAIKLDEVLAYLESVRCSEDENLQYLANTYFQFFDCIREHSSIMNIFLRSDTGENKLIEKRLSIF